VSVSSTQKKINCKRVQILDRKQICKSTFSCIELRFLFCICTCKKYEKQIFVLPFRKVIQRVVSLQMQIQIRVNNILNMKFSDWNFQSKNCLNMLWTKLIAIKGLNKMYYLVCLKQRHQINTTYYVISLLLKDKSTASKNDNVKCNESYKTKHKSFPLKNAPPLWK
jgi:hypothetical protein